MSTGGCRKGDDAAAEARSPADAAAKQHCLASHGGTRPGVCSARREAGCHAQAQVAHRRDACALNTIFVNTPVISMRDDDDGGIPAELGTQSLADRRQLRAGYRTLINDATGEQGDAPWGMRRRMSVCARAEWLTRCAGLLFVQTSATSWSAPTGRALWTR